MLVVIATGVLVLAATVGVILFRSHGRGRPPSLRAGLGHGALALTGVALLAGAVFGADQALTVNAALMLLVLALIGGVFVLLFRLEGERPPGFMVLLHALAAAVALVLLGVALAGG